MKRKLALIEDDFIHVASQDLMSPGLRSDQKSKAYNMQEAEFDGLDNELLM
jgi:hypothetical protein